MKRRTTDTVTVLLDGQAYVATRVIEGTRRMNQWIEYLGIVEHDSEIYEPTENREERMLSAARGILVQLLVRGKLGVPPMRDLPAPERPRLPPAPRKARPR